VPHHDLLSPPKDQRLNNPDQQPPLPHHLRLQRKQHLQHNHSNLKAQVCSVKWLALLRKSPEETCKG
jgi:hypothetical protein